MKKYGLYKLNSSGIKFLEDNNCQVAINKNSKSESRPNYFALSYSANNDIVYLVPITTINTDKKRLNIEKFVKSRGIKKSYYVKWKMDGIERALKISSIFAVSSKMVSQWELRGDIYIVKDQRVINDAEHHIDLMLQYYSSFPEKSENHVIELRDKLVEELSKSEKSQDKSTFKDKLSEAKEKANDHNKDLDTKNNKNNELDH